MDNHHRPAPTQARPMSEPHGTVSLGLRLLGALNAPNAVISPSGVHLALRLAALGATKGSVNAGELRAALGHFTPAPPAADDGVLSTATAVFAAGDVLPEYLAAAKAELDAHVAPLPETADPVNEWVSAATKGKIETILDTIPAATLAVLLSAVHFAAPWRTAFDPNDTDDAYFYASSGAQTPVRMMSLRDVRLRYGVARVGAADAQIVELPYGADGCTAVALLPAHDASLDAAVDALAAPDGAQTFTRALAALKSVEVGYVGLPRFRAEHSAQLVDALRALGVRAAFDGDFEVGAFNRLTDNSATRISQVVHKATLECTEEGTVAAAATAVLMVRTALDTNKPEIVLDRPFLFAVMCDQELVFLCRVDDVVAPQGTV